MNGRTQTGITACASIDDYENNVIKKHENTRAEKELDRIRHVDICDAQTGPIFLAYRDNAAITAIVNKIKHRMWNMIYFSGWHSSQSMGNRGSRGYCGNPKGICGY